MFIGFDQHTTSEHLLLADIEQLCRSGHSVHIVQKSTGGDLPAIPQRLSGYSVSTDVVKFEAADKGNFIARYLVELKYILACRKFLKSDYDAVFIQSNNLAGFAVKAIRRTMPEAIVTFNVQDVFPYNAVYSGKIKRNSIMFQMLSAIQRYGYSHSDHIITISEDMKETLIEDGVPPEKIDVIYNWSYQDELYDNLDITPISYMFNKDYFNVVYAGNIGMMQNVDILIETAKLMKYDESVRFHIVGNGLYKETLESKAKEYDLNNISFWPMQPPEFAPLLYYGADINVIPLVKNVYRTALPSKTATCFACQKPVVFAIGKDSKFGQKIMTEAGCSVTEPDQPDELAREIKKAQNHYERNKIAEFFINNFSISRNSKKYAEIITNER